METLAMVAELLDQPSATYGGFAPANLVSNNINNGNVMKLNICYRFVYWADYLPPVLCGC